jgi:hypothetical protein
MRDVQIVFRAAPTSDLATLEFQMKADDCTEFCACLVKLASGTSQNSQLGPICPYGATYDVVMDGEPHRITLRFADVLYVLC